MAKEYFSLQRADPEGGCCDRRGGFCACLLFLLIALLIAALVTAFIFLIMWQAGHKPIVDTTCGKVEGFYCPHSEAYVFKGIPYATAPVGDLRFKPAEPLQKDEGEEESEDGEGAAGGTCWEGILELDAEKPKDLCVHIDHTSKNNSVHGSEDCLYLNVYTPDVHETGENKTRPVVVFVHGERGVDPKYQPSGQTAKDLDMVFVTVQYRIGAMGFLVVGEEDGNYGLTDLIEALKWVKDNIANFGGNPDSVTLVGQGTGATCVLTLVASPEAKGLFHRAWAMSGAGLPSTPKADAAGDKGNNFVFDATECEDIGCLRNVSAEKLTVMMQEKWSSEDIMNLPTPNVLPYARIVVDGKILTSSLSDALEGLAGSDVPLLIGSAAQSVDADPALGRDLKAQTTNDYLQYLEKTITQKDAEEVLPMYNFSSTRDHEYIVTTMTSDVRFLCSHDKLANKAAAAFTSPVHRYIIVEGPSSEVNAFGEEYPAKYAFRGWDLYGLLGKIGDDMPVDATDEDKEIKKTIRQAFLDLVNSADVKEFPNIALIGHHVEWENKDKREGICTFWDDNFSIYKALY